MLSKDLMSFTKADVVALKARVRKAEENGEASFEFNGREFFTPYAKYLVEYLEGRL